MKISLNWLQSLLPLNQSPEELSDLLTASGLEVEGIEPFESIPGGLKGLVVGKVISCEKHPGADRLRLTQVDTGDATPLRIVCGAPNVASGQKVIVATVGTRLFPTNGEPLVITKSKIRGEVSEGMICAEDEIGTGASHDGILVLPDHVPVGTPAAEYFQVASDTVFEIGLTPNRSDATSHYGVARELAMLLNIHKDGDHRLSPPRHQDLPPASGLRKIAIEVQSTKACPRYSGLVISGVTVAPSPSWIQNRLLAIGIRPVNNIVDITNYVLHELGQPLHAFDADSIRGNKIVVRHAAPGEKLKTLDGAERELQGNDLLICDAERPLCIAGVFGGENSGVKDNTTAIFLESACFDPSAVRQSSKNHALKTDASFRFERGTDPEMVRTALCRAASMILEIAGGTLSMEPLDLYPEKLDPYRVAFSYRNCSDLIGKDIDRGHIRKILLQLGMELESEGTDGILLKVPRFRHDVTREADVIEEILRVYGYNQVEPGRQISYTAANTGRNHSQELSERVCSLLEGFGFSEIMGLSLRPASGASDEIHLLNPLSSDLNVLRTDLLGSALDAVAFNINRKNADLRLFELGKIYRNNGEETPVEKQQLALIVTGDLYQENPHGYTGIAGIHYLRAVSQQLLLKCGIENVSVSSDSHSVSLTSGRRELARIAQVGRDQLKKYGIRQEAVWATFDWDLLVERFSARRIRFREPSRFPAVRRDLALLVDRSVQYAQIEQLAFGSEKKLLTAVNLFDIYEDKKLGDKKSYAVSFTLQDSEGTLTDKQIDAVMEKLIRTYREKLGAELRA